MKKIILLLFLITVINVYAQDPFNPPQTSTLGLGSTNGLSIVDYNNDGYMDIFISNGHNQAASNKNYLYLNNGDGTFIKQTTGNLVNLEDVSGGISSGDYNNDGYEDIMIANVYTRNVGPFSYYNQNRLFSNNGDNTFTAIGFENEHQRYGVTATFADVNEDGLLDVFVINSALQGGPADNKLYMNNSGSFSIDNSSSLSSSSSARAGCSWVDYDGDGDLDLVIAAGGAGQKTSLWQNAGGNFTENVLIASGKTTESVSWGDYDNDGDFDLFVANSADGSNAEADILFQNNNGTLTQVANGNLTTNLDKSTSSAWGDYDNDGDLDLIISNNGEQNDGHHAKLYENVAGVLNENTNATNIINNANFGNTVTFADYDNDGDLDVIYGRDGENQLYENNTISGNIGASVGFSSVKCVGTALTTNKSALGSVVTLSANINSSVVTQIRDISSQTGKGSQNDTRAHFGLGDASSIDSITVDWIGSSSDNTYTDLPINKFMVFTQGDLSVSANVLPTQNFMYLFGNTKGAVEFTTADADGGSLTMVRTDSDPGGTFDGTSATSPNGSTITPSSVYADKYWTISQANLTGFTSTVYFDASGLTDSPDLDEVVLMKRVDNSSDWTALNTSRIGNTLYATGVTSLGEFGIGYENSGVLVETKIFLEGAYDATTNLMRTEIAGVLPTTSPYTEDPRTVTSIPNDIVDWILVELRTSATGSAVVSKSAFLHKDGRIVSDDASSGVIEMDAPAGDYYIVLKHRNHIAVMSANAISLNGSTSLLYDFTN